MHAFWKGNKNTFTRQGVLAWFRNRFDIDRTRYAIYPHRDWTRLLLCMFAIFLFLFFSALLISYQHDPEKIMRDEGEVGNIDGASDLFDQKALERVVREFAVLDDERETLLATSTSSVVDPAK